MPKKLSARHSHRAVGRHPKEKVLRHWKIWFPILLFAAVVALILPKGLEAILRRQLRASGASEVELDVAIAGLHGFRATHVHLHFPGDTGRHFDSVIDADVVHATWTLSSFLNGRLESIEVERGNFRFHSADALEPELPPAQKKPFPLKSLLRSLPIRSLRCSSCEVEHQVLPAPVALELSFDQESVVDVEMRTSIAGYSCSQSLRWELESTELSLHGELRAAGGQATKLLAWQGKGKLNDENLSVAYELADEGGDRKAPGLRGSGTITHDLRVSSGGASLSLDEQEVTKLLRLASSAVGKLPSFLQVAKGKFSSTIEYPWGTGRAPTGSFRLADVSGMLSGYAFGGLHASLSLLGAEEGVAVSVGKVSAETLVAPLPLRNLAAEFGFASRRLSLRAASMELLGGRVELAEKISVDSFRSFVLPLRVQGLSLKQILETYPQTYLKGDGVLDGAFTVHSDDGVFTVEEASFESRPPGGKLQGQIAGGPLAAEALGAARDALSDFHYEMLRSTGALAADGAVKLSVFLRGNNPAFQNGRAVEFTVNIEDNLYQLLHSIRLIQNFSPDALPKS